MVETQNSIGNHAETSSRQEIVDLSADSERWAAAQAKVAAARAQAAIEKAAAVERMGTLSFEDVRELYYNPNSSAERTAAMEVMLARRTSFVL